ncbi:MAG: LytR/AlgR family response regulator transcription factor [Bacteroidia bacterium]
MIKPINTADLKKVIKKVTDLKLLISQNNLNKSESGTYSRSLMSLIEQVNTPTAYQQTITIEHNKKINIISVDDIQFINSHSKSVFINHFKKGNFFVDITLKEFEEMLDPEIFIRCHQSYIVNKNFISEIEANRSGIIKLSTQIEIPISARKKSHVLKILG